MKREASVSSHASSFRSTRSDALALGTARSARSSRARPLRVFFAAGSGDVIGTYEQWREGRDDHSIVSIAYSSQFYDVCRRLGTRAHVVAAHAWRPGVNDAQFTLRHRPIPFKTTGSALYFAGQVLYAVDLMARAVAFRAQVVVVSTGLL